MNKTQPPSATAAPTIIITKPPQPATFTGTPPASPARAAAPAAAAGTPAAPATLVAQSPAPNVKARRFPIPNILIVGESGSGKTRSLKSLPWESGRIAFIDTEVKGFDWIRRVPEDCYFEATDHNRVLALLAQLDNNPKFDTIVVDSFTGYSLTAHEAMKATRTGYDIYTFYNSAVVQFLKRCSSYNKRIIVTAIPEVLTAESSGNTVGTSIKRAAVHGKELEGKVESMFAYAVFLRVEAQPNARAKHLFVLSPDGKSQAKIPEGVTDKLVMDNDVNALLELAKTAEAKY